MRPFVSVCFFCLLLARWSPELCRGAEAGSLASPFASATADDPFVLTPDDKIGVVVKVERGGSSLYNPSLTLIEMLEKMGLQAEKITKSRDGIVLRVTINFHSLSGGISLRGKSRIDLRDRTERCTVDLEVTRHDFAKRQEWRMASLSGEGSYLFYDRLAVGSSSGSLRLERETMLNDKRQAFKAALASLQWRLNQIVDYRLIKIGKIHEIDRQKGTISILFDDGITAAGWARAEVWSTYLSRPLERRARIVFDDYDPTSIFRTARPANGWSLNDVAPGDPIFTPAAISRN